VRARVKAEDIGGPQAVDDIVAAWAFADADPYRAATHNKGIMNGVAAVALAFAQDHRAIEAGAHSYAARTGRDRSLSKWSKDENGDLVGEMTLPLAVGLVGGATRSHPVAQVSRKILGVSKASELAEVMGAVGLAQNLAALRALSHEGIQKGHMKLHARNLALQAGAEPHEVEEVVARMIGEGSLTASSAEDILRRMRDSDRHPSRKYN
ncbi:MAG: 3-hydroxy-3-methylglutaryl-CoA reductase, partial [Thermoplasmata archaeon]